jgi:hypothetical protein
MERRNKFIETYFKHYNNKLSFNLAYATAITAPIFYENKLAMVMLTTIWGFYGMHKLLNFLHTSKEKGSCAAGKL